MKKIKFEKLAVQNSCFSLSKDFLFFMKSFVLFSVDWMRYIENTGLYNNRAKICDVPLRKAISVFVLRYNADFVALGPWVYNLLINRNCISLIWASELCNTLKGKRLHKGYLTIIYQKCAIHIVYIMRTSRWPKGDLQIIKNTKKFACLILFNLMGTAWFDPNLPHSELKSY